ncbi:hypothetical protein BD779DRAFT_1467525 [Infundibulicybe gibba]|nr:hypothetical protein BD779DRAFT_1467525 [Infundibulicybe gibba]
MLADTDVDALKADSPQRTISFGSFHPSFLSPEGDAVLAANGGKVLFRVHSFTLKTTSGWFKTMYSLPQKPLALVEDVFYMDEDADVLESLLRMICGLSILPIDSYDMIDSLLDAAEKYDMPGPLSILRLLVTTPPLLDQPFRLYIAACRFGWECEAKMSATRTLTHNLYDPELQLLLKRLPTTALLNLFNLHHTRRELLRTRLNEPPFLSGGTATCIECQSTIEYQTWRELKYKIILEMDARPLGDTILNPGLLQWPESLACWAAKCPNAHCTRLLYDKTETIRVIKECIDALPNTI